MFESAYIPIKNESCSMDELRKVVINAYKRGYQDGISSSTSTVDMKDKNIDNLPTMQEFRDRLKDSFSGIEFSEPRYQCPKCGGGMCKNLHLVLISYPVQYQYECNQCGHIEYEKN